MLDIGGHWHFDRTRDARHRFDHLARWHEPAVGIPEGRGDAPLVVAIAESFGLEQPRRDGIQVLGSTIVGPRWKREGLPAGSVTG
jgi:hypothetical protein